MSAASASTSRPWAAASRPSLVWRDAFGGAFEAAACQVAPLLRKVHTASSVNLLETLSVGAAQRRWQCRFGFMIAVSRNTPTARTAGVRRAGSAAPRCCDSELFQRRRPAVGRRPASRRHAAFEADDVQARRPPPAPPTGRSFISAGLLGLPAGWLRTCRGGAPGGCRSGPAACCRSQTAAQPAGFGDVCGGGRRVIAAPPGRRLDRPCNRRRSSGRRYRAAFLPCAERTRSASSGARRYSTRRVSAPPRPGRLAAAQAAWRTRRSSFSSDGEAAARLTLRAWRPRCPARPARER